jgi:GT2 family glycosyltransferase
MNILVCCLTYGNRPIDKIHYNLERTGFPFNVAFINREGIANALNDGIDLFKKGDYESLAFLANDIIEPDNWLIKKAMALDTYERAGIVASSVDFKREYFNNEHIISNWLISKEVIDKIGYFNELYYPYGPIDLEYCERVWLGGFNTYYAMDCIASTGDHAIGEEYGYNKQKVVEGFWGMYKDDINAYKNGTKNIKLERL